MGPGVVCVNETACVVCVNETACGGVGHRISFLAANIHHTCVCLRVLASVRLLTCVCLP